MAIFTNAKVGDKVILKNNIGENKNTSICEITSRSIRIRKYDLYRFNRNGIINKRFITDGLYLWIVPINE